VAGRKGEDSRSGAASKAWSEPAERELLERFRRGEEAAFEEFFSKYREAVYAVAWKVLGDREEALDVVQEAFLKAYRGAADFRAESGFYAWVRRIAVNLAIDRVRARRGDDSPLEEEILAEERHAPGAARLAEEDPADQAAGAELGVALAEALESLGPEHRTVLVLHAQEGLSYKEIAREMNCPIGTVMSRLHYARRTLAGKLRRFLSDEE
jgi:RNA polymerase sigma-70 factor (ECF subfamily)